MDATRLLTLNVWNVFGPWPLRLREMVRWIVDLSPDAVCLQEVWQGPDVDQLAQILSGLDEHGCEYFASYECVPFEGGEIGNAILTRVQPRTRRAVALPAGSSSEPERRLLGVAVGRTWILTTHLSPRDHQADVRWRQVCAIRAAIAELLEASPDMLVLLGGDLNAKPDAPEIRELVREEGNVQIVDAWAASRPSDPGHTWSNARNPFTTGQDMSDGRVDYVIAASPHGCDVRDAHIVCEEPLTGVLASDHFGVLAEVARG